MSNLKPFTGAEDPRRSNGRKKGSKNISTIVREILDDDVDLKLPISEEIKEYAANNGPTSFAKAMSMAMVVKAINGNVRAADWVTNQYDKSPNPESVFSKTELIFNVVPDRRDLGVEKNKV